MSNELELIFSNDTAYADSRVIARYFKKSHAHVIRDIHNMFLKLGDEVTETNFGFSYKDSTGRTLPCYHLDFDLTVISLVITKWRKFETDSVKRSPQMFNNVFFLSDNKRNGLVPRCT